MLRLCYFIAIVLKGIHANPDDIWEKVPCNEDFAPDNCDFSKIPLLTVEDYERCGPAALNKSARNYILAAAGSRTTYRENKNAFKRIRIVPKLLPGDLSRTSLSVTTLGQRMSIPIGISPVAFQNIAHPLGELATFEGISNMGTVMILSSFASTTIEDMARASRRRPSQMWLQVYIFENRSLTADLISRAERAGFRAVVVTSDAPGGKHARVTCDARRVNGKGKKIANIPDHIRKDSLVAKSQSLNDIAWIRSITNLPVVAKGILSANDAKRVIKAGANAILVSNHGGRQLDGAPATIDVLSDIVHTVRSIAPDIDVYIDSGIRNGRDIYKAIAKGAKMVFIGRPALWGLAKGGVNGVKDVFNILKNEFEEAMILAGSSHPSQISEDTLLPSTVTNY